ncbi:hypothetical protein C0J52_07141 [Blattella germanica]|nr:hypothetical protein C0J52_07141 [Blattella germanica]
MPRNRGKLKFVTLQSRAFEFAAEGFGIGNGNLLCKVCGAIVNWMKRDNCVKHCRSASHRLNLRFLRSRAVRVTAMASSEKRSSVELSIQQKKLVLDELTKGRSQRAIAADFGISKTTVGNILRKRESILRTWRTHANSNHIYRKRKPKNSSAIIQDLWNSFGASQQRIANHFSSLWGKSVSRRCVGDILWAQEKWLRRPPSGLKKYKRAKHERLEDDLDCWLKRNPTASDEATKQKVHLLGAQMGITQFVYSSGWLHRFKQRHKRHELELPLGTMIRKIKDVYKKWTVDDMNHAVMSVLDGNCSIRRASLLFNIPHSSLQRYVETRRQVISASSKPVFPLRGVIGTHAFN